METVRATAFDELCAYADMLEEQVAQLQATLDSRVIVEQAKGAVSARVEVPTDMALEMIRGLARSQRRDIHGYFQEIVDNGGRLDGIEPHRPTPLRT